jgi:AcrR family transcriptional regulator
VAVSLTDVKGRDGLLAATIRVLDREGISGVTLRAVGKEAHVSAPAVYWHFEDKETLLDAVVQQIAAQFVGRVRTGVSAAAPADELAAIGDAFVEFVVEHPHRFQLLFREPPRRTMNKPLRSPAPPPHTTFGVLVAAVERGMANGTLRQDDARSVALTIAAMGQGLVSLLERNRFADRREFADFARLSFRRLIGGLGA